MKTKAFVMPFGHNKGFAAIRKLYFGSKFPGNDEGLDGSIAFW